MFRNIIVYLLLALSMMTAVAENSYPVLEFIKDGEVIESRQMTDAEYRAYTSLKSLEKQLSKLEGPLKQLESTIDEDARLIEAETMATLGELKETLNDFELESLSDLSQLSELAVLGEMDFAKIGEMVEKMQPMIDEVTAMSTEISTTTLEFKEVIMNNYSDSEVDQIKILDGNDANVIIGRTKINID